MIRYLINKTGYGFFVLWGVISLVFLIFYLKPGDSTDMILGDRATSESREILQKELGLDLPVWKQYLFYVNDLLPISLHNSNAQSHLFLDPQKYTYIKLFEMGQYSPVLKWPYLRRSYQNQKKVTTIIAEAMPGTIVLAFTAIILAMILGLLFGILAAYHRGGFWDNSTFIFSVLGMSGPSFFFAVLISWLFGFVWFEHTSIPGLPLVFMIFAGIIGWVSGLKKTGKINWNKLLKFSFQGLFFGLGFWLIGKLINSWSGSDVVPLVQSYISLPGTGLSQSGSLYSIDVYAGPYLSIKNLILPAITLGIRPLAVIIQLTRSSLIDEMECNYVRTARAKGLSAFGAMMKHALRNALNPVVTAISGWFASLLAGAVFIEFVFGWKGLGLELYNALLNEDFPVIMGAVLVIASIFVIINLLVDLIYALLDPRIRLE